MNWFKTLCEYMQGAVETPPAGAAWLAKGWVRGLWWGALLGAILLFCGQSSKFIYIDF